MKAHCVLALFRIFPQNFFQKQNGHNVMTTTITLERLAKRGYESLLDYYEKKLHNLMNGCIQGPFVQWCESRTSSLTGGETVYSISDAPVSVICQSFL